jgi:hypothetical protein
VSRHPIRSLWRAAACAALLAFALLPHGHLRGHEEVSDARAHAGSAPGSLEPTAPSGHADFHPTSCPVCLSLARARDAIAGGAGLELPVLAAAAPCAPPRSPLRPAAPASSHTAPRAPPLV